MPGLGAAVRRPPPRGPDEQMVELAVVLRGPPEEPGAGAAAPPQARESQEGTATSPSQAGRWGARLALLALCATALGGPLARWLEPPCPPNAEWRRKHAWPQLWPLYAVSAPASLAFAAWCVLARWRFEDGSSLHAWTWRFGACAALHGVTLLACPGLGCDGGPLGSGSGWKGGATLTATHMTYYATVFVQWHLLVLRLRALGRPCLAAAARAALLLGVACAAVFRLGFSLRVGVQAGLLSPRSFGLVPVSLAVSIGGMVLFHVCQGVGFCCGAWGLLAGAARAARSGRAGAAQAAGWVGATGVLALASLILSYAQAILMVATNEGLSWAIVWACDNALNCLSAALLSGLVGPPELRRLAEEAFERINSYGEGQLQMFYLEYLDYLDEARVKWVRCGYLRQLAEAGSAMVRCQEVPPDQAVVGRSGFPRARGEPKHRFVLSHPWLSREHPDPSGVKLQRLVQQLDLLDASDSDAIFIDYMGLPQNNKQDPEYRRMELEDRVPKPGEHPAVRTEAEEALFKKALGSMELIYSMGNTPVIVLPMDDEVNAGTEYLSRGWCFLEFALAFSFGNIANAEIHEDVEKMLRRAADLKMDTVDGFQEGFKATHFTNKGDETVVFNLFKHTLDKKVGQR